MPIPTVLEEQVHVPLPFAVCVQIAALPEFPIQVEPGTQYVPAKAF